MFRAVLLLGVFVSEVVSGQTGQATEPQPLSIQPEPPLVEAQTLLDHGKLSEAEGMVRRYLDDHVDSADAHYLLAYILFREQNPKSSIEEYQQGARHRT